MCVLAIMRITAILFPLLFAGHIFAQNTPVNTETKEIDYQDRQVYFINDVSFSNDFPGGRLNEIEGVNDTLVRITIKPENSPINPSAWYAFKIWSENEKKMTIHLTYEDGFHRYYPKVSSDGISWNPLDTAKFFWDPNEAPTKFLGQTGDSITFRTQAFMNITTSPDTLWIAAQEVITSHDNADWVDLLSKKPDVEKEIVGESPLNAPLWKVNIGNKTSKKAIIVFSSQHPPEVTGYLAMRAFIEEVTSDSELSEKFRSEFLTMVVPMVNPDGVDQGHWRHNTGGVDLNRDWSNLHQSENRMIDAFFRNYLDQTETKVYFGIDFHSTWKDIFYILNRNADVTQVTKPWLEGMERLLPGFSVVEREVPVVGGGTSVRWFYQQANTDAVTYEVGDDTDRSYLKEKARAAAVSLMTVLLDMN